MSAMKLPAEPISARLVDRVSSAIANAEIIHYRTEPCPEKWNAMARAAIIAVVDEMTRYATKDSTRLEAAAAFLYRAFWRFR